MLGRKRVRENTEEDVQITDDYESDGEGKEDHAHDNEPHEHSEEEEEPEHPPRHLFQQLFTWQSQVGTVNNNPPSSNLEPTVPDFIFTFENCTLVENFHPFSAGNHIPIIQVNLWTSQITLAVTGSEIYTFDLVMGAISNEPLDNLGEEEEEEENEEEEQDEEKDQSA
jgi:hypothetical protein